MEKSSGRKVKTLRSDNGGEYTSTEFTEYLSKEGIKHEFTIPHTPQQNGIAERLNRTLIEGVRTMLTDSKLPRKFWAETLSTCVYLRNRSPTKSVGRMTPYEAWNETKPNVSALRVFGCSAYAHVPKVQRRKLDLKSRKCVMLGYGSNQKGYRLYDLNDLKIIHCRDVVFDEQTLPGIQSEKELSSVPVELAVDDDWSDQTEDEPTETNPTDTLPEMVVRRSTREVRKPDRYSHNLTLISTEEMDPSSLAEAMAAPDKAECYGEGNAVTLRKRCLGLG